MFLVGILPTYYGIICYTMKLTRYLELKCWSSNLLQGCKWMEIYYINHHILISINLLNNYHSFYLPSGGQIDYDAWLILDLEDNNTWIWMWINYGDALQVLPMDLQTGQLTNLFDFCQPITDVYCDQLTNESACILYHSI